MGFSIISHQHTKEEDEEDKKEGMGSRRSSLATLILLITLTTIMGVAWGSRFMVLSDIHLDPSYEKDAKVFNFCRNESAALLAPTCVSSPPPPFPNDAPQEFPLNQPQFGQRGCDTSFDLMMSTFRAMKRVDPNPDFILLSVCLSVSLDLDLDLSLSRSCVLIHHRGMKTDAAV